MEKTGYDAEYPIMNQAALTQVLADMDRWVAGLTGDSETWKLGYEAATQRMQMYAKPIIDDCK